MVLLFLRGFSGSALVDFELKLATSSTVSEQQKLELWRMKFEIAGTATEGVLDRNTIYKKIFNLTDEEIEKIMEGKRADKLEDLTLESMQAPEAQQPEGEEGVPGEEELPSTLGGEGETSPEGGGAPEGAGENVPPEEGLNTGDLPNLSEISQEIEEVKNMGSTGDRAEMAVDKGKDLFSTGEDAKELTFGTQKQTASDPNDMRALRRLVSRPFSESAVSKKGDQGASDRRLREASDRVSKIDLDVRNILRRAKKL